MTRPLTFAGDAVGGERKRRPELNLFQSMASSDPFSASAPAKVRNIKGSAQRPSE